MSIDKLKSHFEGLNQSMQVLQVELDSFMANYCGVNIASDEFLLYVNIFMLACFVGYHVVWNVTPSLHTPLMSVTNAISGIVIIGSIAATSTSGITVNAVLGFLATVLASINIFGGFGVTHKMLGLFQNNKKGKQL